MTSQKETEALKAGQLTAELAFRTVGIVGAGTMGSGIAQLAIEHGHEVILHDTDESAIQRGEARIRDGLARRARKHGLSGGEAEAGVDGAMRRFREAHALDTIAEEADVVIEAALEDVEIKQAIFRVLDASARPDALLATNTSAISIGAIAAATRHPERVLGLHFFNPAPVMPLVEVVAVERTDPAMASAAAALVTGWGKTAVRCADAPGFIVNRVNRPFTLEALRILAEERSTIEEIDAAIRSDGFPMGPFELMDLVGIDVNYAVARALYEAFHHASRFQPSPIQERLVAGGRLGRKSGEGFYVYDEDGGRMGPAAEFAGGVPPADRLPDREIVERIVLGVINEAYHALDDRVAQPADIDLAMRLGAAHPLGPFELVEQLGGPGEVFVLIDGLAYREGDRFRPAVSLHLDAER